MKRLAASGWLNIIAVVVILGLTVMAQPSTRRPTLSGAWAWFIHYCAGDPRAYQYMEGDDSAGKSPWRNVAYRAGSQPVGEVDLPPGVSDIY